MDIILKLDLQSAKLAENSSFQKSEDLVGLTPYHGSLAVQTKTKLCMTEHEDVHQDREGVGRDCHEISSAGMKGSQE